MGFVTRICDRITFIAGSAHARSELISVQKGSAASDIVGCKNIPS